ncbi:MAG: hypothetical protein ABWZ64_09585 [Xanthobacteraceae bacterium]
MKETMMNRASAWIAALPVFTLSIALAHAAELDQAAVPEQIDWKDPLGVSGAKTAVLFGDPSKPGLYVMLVKWLRAISAVPTTSQRPILHGGERNLVGRHRSKV